MRQRQGKDRYTSRTYPQVGAHGVATLDGGMLSLSKMGRIRLRLHRPLAGIATGLSPAACGGLFQSSARALHSTAVIGMSFARLHPG
jgi:hypothetical protein